MKTLEKTDPALISNSEKATVDRALNTKTISKVEMKKVEAAREFLKKHPIPEHLLRK